MHPDVIQVILNAAPGRIVYVSCNPATQARDLQLMDDYYKVGAVQPVDMFPHTPHVENVVLLEKRSDADIKQKLKERKEREQAIAEAKAAKEAEALAKVEARSRRPDRRRTESLPGLAIFSPTTSLLGNSERTWISEEDSPRTTTQSKLIK